MQSKKMERAFEEAEARFEEVPESEIETGLDIEDATILQLRKACRLLSASQSLLKEKGGFYVLIIDASFVAIERSFQAYLLERGQIKEGDVISSHTKLYEEARNVGLFDEDFEHSLTQLWNNNRSKMYYRSGKPSRDRAEAIYNLALEVHKQIVSISDLGYDCLCEV